jgi:hypothetical protein
MKMKRKTATTTKKGTATKKGPAKKKATPAGKPAAKNVPNPVAPATETTRRAGTYTPSAVQGIGWAPFRYPPQ